MVLSGMAEQRIFMAKSKLAKRMSKRRKKAPRKNPETSSDMSELAVTIGAGFGGYAVTRLASRMAYAQAVKKFPNAAPHIHVAASALGAAGIWYGTQKWEKVEDYHEAATIGAGIALLQTAIQTYMPKFGWVVGDVAPEQYGAGKKKAKAKAKGSVTILPPDAAPDALPPAEEALGESFDLDALLASDDTLEAVPVGHAPPADDFDLEGEGAGFSDGYDGLMEGWDGMLQ